MKNRIVVDFQLEGQLKELMEQKDTVQSQLDNFRRVTSDGNFNDHATRQWVSILLLLHTIIKPCNNLLNNILIGLLLTGSIEQVFRVPSM
jgi:hypothetical protein